MISLLVLKQMKDLCLLVLMIKLQHGEIKAFVVNWRLLFQPCKDVVLNLLKPFLPNKTQHENFKNNESQKDSDYFHSIISDDKNKQR